MGLVRLALLVVLFLAALPQAALAIDLVDVADGRGPRSLQSYLAGLETTERTIPIERPDSRTALRELMTLSAKGPGPRFHWVAAGFGNSDKEPRSVVITIPDQGFVGSGFYRLKPVGPRIVSVASAGEVKLERLPVIGQSAYAFTMAPGTTAAIAFEVIDPSPPGMVLWQRSAFDARKDYLSFFRGALLGVAMLLAAALFALYGYRARVVFPIAGGFALSCVLFMLLQAGHVPPLLAWLGLPALSLQVVRAVAEGSMAACLILLLATISELHRVSRLAASLLMVAGGLAFAIPIYGFTEPMLAATIARGLFAATATGGFLLIFRLWRQGEVKVDQALVTWSAVLLWAFLATVAALAGAGSKSLSPVLLAGLCAVLVILAFTLAHYAFSQGYLSRHFFREAGRHALALAGARTYVWDWQPEDGDLFVSEEIERALAQPPGIMTEAGAEAFLELMHPSDRTAYLAAIEEASYDGRLPIEKEFRLRHGDGSYRWFKLRARAIAGQGQRTVRCIGTLADVTNAKLAEERLLNDAVYDLVTGLPNRALFVDRLTRALDRRDRAEPSALFVLLVDIDRFKLVNDAMGHDAGDALLAIVGRRLNSEAGSSGGIARLPGDQFAILFAEEPGGRGVETFATSLLKAVARPMALDGQEYFLTASIGIAQVREADQSAEQLMKDAALALYEAKRRGSQSVELFSPAMRDDRAELVVLESELRRAIERNEIEVHYQPIARLADMQLAGLEALVRWRHPVLGLLAPASFLGLAEQTGMIKNIGHVVLNEAGRQLGIWQRAHRLAEPVFVAVNISSAQLIEPTLLDDVKQVLHREGLPRGSFKIEVTESVVMQYPERAGQILERLRELGVGIACDDFGTGYSSLSSLRRLPFDTLKVDRSFIVADPQDDRASTILDAIIAMAHALGLNVVGEGIENQEQVDNLGALDCDFGQGYFIGRPMTAKQVSDALAGLPYASASGRTAVTWLWERALKDPPPEPAVRRVTAEDIEEVRGSAVAPPPKPVPAIPDTDETFEPPGEAEVRPESEHVAAPPAGLAPLAPRLAKAEAPAPVPEPEAEPAPEPESEPQVAAEPEPEPQAEPAPEPKPEPEPVFEEIILPEAESKPKKRKRPAKRRTRKKPAKAAGETPPD